MKKEIGEFWKTHKTKILTVGSVTLLIGGSALILLGLRPKTQIVTPKNLSKIRDIPVPENLIKNGEIVEFWTEDGLANMIANFNAADATKFFEEIQKNFPKEFKNGVISAIIGFCAD